MRFVDYRLHDQRIILKFLFFPRNIGGETRWLELTRIRQIRVEYNEWKDLEFID